MRRANLGKAWEACLRVQHDRYRRDRLAVVFQTPPPVKVLSDVRGGRFQACFDGAGPPDFAGVLCGTGRAVVFDAKHTSQAKFPLSMIKRHQAMDLTAVGPLGYAFIALRMGRAAWVLPWDGGIGDQFWDKTAARSLSADDCDRIGFRMRELGDWFGVLPATVREA